MATWYDFDNKQHPFSPSPRAALIADKTLNLNDLNFELKSVMGTALLQQQDIKVQSGSDSTPTRLKPTTTRRGQGFTSRRG